MNPFLRDVILTSGTWIVVATESLLAISLLGRLMGPQALAEYLLVRRVAAWLLTGAVLGLGVGLPRYVAFAKPHSRDRQLYFLVALACALGTSLALLLGLNAAPRLSAEWLLGKPELQYLVFPLSILLLSYALNTVVFGQYRGCLVMTRANALSLVNYAVIPLLAIVAFWRQNSISLITTATALPIIGVSLLLAVPLFVPFRPKIGELTRTFRELLAYGVPRLPGDFASGAIFSVASITAAHYLPLPQVAPMLLGIGMLMLVGASVNPLNQVLLSKISMMLSQNRWLQARESIEYLLTG